MVLVRISDRSCRPARDRKLDHEDHMEHQSGEQDHSNRPQGPVVGENGLAGRAQERRVYVNVADARLRIGQEDLEIPGEVGHEVSDQDGARDRDHGLLAKRALKKTQSPHTHLTGRAVTLNGMGHLSAVRKPVLRIVFGKSAGCAGADPAP